MKCIVLGGCGFIGSHLTDKLIEEGNEVIVIDNLYSGKIENLNKKAKFHLCDITQLEQMDNIFKKEKPDYVFHLAAMARIQLSIDKPLETFETNVRGTLNVLECSKRNNVKRVIYSSSSSVYGDQEIPLKEDMVSKPISPYALHKHQGEEYCKIYSKFYNLETVCLRYFNVIGTRVDLDSAYKLVIAIWAEQKRKKEPLSIYGNGQQTRDFSFVQDVVNANILSMKAKRKMLAEPYNIGSGKETKILDLAKYFNWKMKYIKNPRPYEERRKKADISKAKKELGWAPKVNFNKGINEIIETL